MSELSKQELKPFVLRTSPAKIPSGADANNMNGASIAEYVMCVLMLRDGRPEAALEGVIDDGNETVRGG